MKKILLLIAAFALLSVIVSCSSDDEPKRGNGVFNENTLMVNHVFNTKTNEVVGLEYTHNKIVFDTAKHTASLKLVYNDGGDTLSLMDVIATPKRQGFYELRSPSYAQFSGYVDISQSTMRYTYTTADGIRVISTISDVFFMKTHSTISYDDTITATEMENIYYQFTVLPGMENAIVKVMGGIVHAKDLKNFSSITAMSVPYTITANGYEFAGRNIATTAIYKTTIDSTLQTERTTTEYPFKTFNATVDMVNDHMDAIFMLGSSATVVASGSTYPDYTVY